MEQNEKNRQKDQELTKEELEQVNGGSAHSGITLPDPKRIKKEKNWQDFNETAEASFYKQLLRLLARGNYKYPHVSEVLSSPYSRQGESITRRFQNFRNLSKHPLK